jgi:hypothetical protein
LRDAEFRGERLGKGELPGAARLDERAVDIDVDCVLAGGVGAGDRGLGEERGRAILF